VKHRFGRKDVLTFQKVAMHRKGNEELPNGEANTTPRRWQKMPQKANKQAKEKKYEKPALYQCPSICLNLFHQIPPSSNFGILRGSTYPVNTP
jgi:hypothetical protein